MIRVRFAPSPTGELHIGGARTALYNYLYAKQAGGQFIIRIEDTDQERFVAGSLERILAGLRWLGLAWDEGPDCGGPYSPYVQSQRLELYSEHAQQLLKSEAAYWCFCTADRLEVLRQVQTADKQPTRYDRKCLALKPDEVKAKLERQEPHVLRLRVPDGSTTVNDLIRGPVITKNISIDDQVLLKSDGYPTYHLANVVDDHLMGITHVIRGEEWLPSTPKHVMLYQALGWEVPSWAHLPNVLNEQRAKLSKRRDGEAVWLSTYQQAGYMPQAMVNYLVLLGWHPTDDQEVFSLSQLERVFSLGRVQKSGAIFNQAKLDWFNATYLKSLPVLELDKMLQPYYQELQRELPRRVTETILLTTVLQSRLTTLSSVKVEANWFFADEINYDPTVLVPKGGNQTKTSQALSLAAQALSGVADWQVDTIKAALETLVRPGALTRSELFWPVRVALTGQATSPDAFSVAYALGRDETLRRLSQASLATKL